MSGRSCSFSSVFLWRGKEEKITCRNLEENHTLIVQISEYENCVDIFCWLYKIQTRQEIVAVNHRYLKPRLNSSLKKWNFMYFYVAVKYFAEFEFHCKFPSHTPGFQI